MWRFLIRYKMVILSILILILIKLIWVVSSCWGNGSFEKEKQDILQRRNWLVDKIAVEPRQLLNEMPSGVGLQYSSQNLVRVFRYPVLESITIIRVGSEWTLMPGSLS